MIPQPGSAYVNWSAYDELSDNIELSEELAMKQLREMLRLRKDGVRFDYYVNDCYWYAPDGAYRAFRRPHWPSGPDKFLALCNENEIKPGLWIASNVLSKMHCPPEWRDSLDARMPAMCCFCGGFMDHLLETLHGWYARGVRLFKFDFANFAAAPERIQRTMLPSEIRARNEAAFRGALMGFRGEHPDCLMLGYNGLEEINWQSRTDLPMRKFIDTRWLECFDSLHAGDVRPADVPAFNFWRSLDVYTDHMVRLLEANGVPLRRIDSSALMLGQTNAAYRRGKACWKSSFLLSMARGGWVNILQGNLDLLDAADARWMARAQQLFLDHQREASFRTFGGLPGSGLPYGFMAMKNGDGLATVVNPSQRIADLLIDLKRPMNVLFCDSGFKPRLQDNVISLGPEQMAVVGIGSHSGAEFDLGTEEDAIIPRNIREMEARFTPDGERGIAATITPPAEGSLRILFRQQDESGTSRRTSGGSSAQASTLGKLLSIRVTQRNTPVPLKLHYDRAIWAGLSWAAAEAELNGGEPWTIRCTTADPGRTRLSANVYLVQY